jgi:hypothetical protein
MPRHEAIGMRLSGHAKSRAKRGEAPGVVVFLTIVELLAMTNLRQQRF